MKIKTDQTKIQIETLLFVTPDRAWELITRQVHIEKWWGDHVSLEAKTGGRFREVWFAGGKQVITSGNITLYKPPETLHLGWADEDWPGETRVIFTFAENPAGSLLMFEHTGWEIHPENKRQKLLKAHADGWSKYLNQLAEYAKTAEV